MNLYKFEQMGIKKKKKRSGEKSKINMEKKVKKNKEQVQKEK